MRRFPGALALVAALFLAVGPAGAQQPADFPYDGVIRIDTPHDFETLWSRLETAVGDHDMLVVTRASASRGAASRGVEIAGNAIFGVYRNDFAVRMLDASVAAGIEAPLRYYLIEGEDGTTALVYRQPTAVFGPYGSADLDAMAAELDEIFAAIAEQATAAE